MGIRLVCTQGHKLHVKAFLAGKRAICPQCGEKVLVPLGNDAPAAGGESLPTGSPIGPETTIDLADLPSALPGGLHATSAVTTAPSGAAPAIVPTAAAGATALAARQSAAPTATPAALGIPPVAASAGGVASDAFAENPDAVWYVRPKTGGQYGPAPGSMMRQWISQSRVASDSLVWREGWAQWRTASEVFAELGAGNSPNHAAAPMPVGGLVSGAAGPVATPAAGVAAPSTVRYHARRRSTGRLVALIVVLGLLVVSLAVVLVYVVQNKI